MSEQIEKSVQSEESQEKKQCSLTADEYSSDYVSAAAAVVGSALGIAAGSEMGRAALAGGNQFLLNAAQCAPQIEISTAPEICFSQVSPVNDYQPSIDAGAANIAFTSQAVCVSDISML